MLTLSINITMLWFFFILRWQMGEYLWVTCSGSVSLVRLHNSRCSGGHRIFFITVHYVEQTGISIPTRCGVSYGCYKYFLAYLTSEMPGFLFYIGIQTQHKAIVPVHLRNIGREALSSLSGCETQGLYDLNWIILLTLNTLQAGQIFPLTGALRAMGTTIILGSSASWWGQIRKDSYFPPPDSLAALLHSFNFYMCLVAVLLPVSREN